MLKDSINNSVSHQTKKPIQKSQTDFGSPVKVTLFAVSIFILSQLIAAILIGLFAVIAFGENGYEKIFDGNVTGNLAFILITELITFLLVFRIIGAKRSSLKKIGLIKPRIIDIAYAAGGFIIYYAVLVVVSLIVYSLIPSIDTEQKQDLGFEELKNNYETLVAFISLVILPPLGEEILARGYLFSGLRYRLRFWPSAIIVSTLFSAAHLQLGNGETPLWAAAINTFVLSIVLVFVREKSGSLWPAIYIHAMNNLVAFIYLFKDNIF